MFSKRYVVGSIDRGVSGVCEQEVIEVSKYVRYEVVPR